MIMMIFRKKCAAVLLILGLVLFSACGNADKTGNGTANRMDESKNLDVKTEVKDGVMYVYNPAQPLKGDITLELEKVLELDNVANPQVPANFNLLALDAEDNIFLVNNNEVKAYKFNKEGKLLAEFLRKGEGPGEFLRQVGGFQVIGKDVWASHANKIAHFDNNGVLIEETKFDKSYTHIEMVDENRFIADYYEYGQESKEALKPLKRVCALMQKDQTVLVKFLEAENAGFTELRSETRILRLYDGSFSNDILHAYHPEQGLVYLFLTSEYKIIVKNLNGETQRVILCDRQNKVIDDAVKAKILETFKRMPPEDYQLLKTSLPKVLCIISRIQFLPNGYLAVHRKIDFQEDEIDIFDNQGRFVYTLKPSAEIPNYIRFRFFNNKGMVINNFDDRDVYVMYRIKNLPEIFGN